MKKINVVVEKTKDGYSAYAEDYPVFTVGSSMDEIKNYMLKAINLYFEETGGKKVSIDDVNLNMDLESFFELYPVVNAAGLSKRIGMNKSLLSQYVTGKKKASEKQVQKILDGIRELGRELSHVQF